MPALEEDTQQEWEKPLAEIETEKQFKHKGRPPKAADDKETSGQVGPKSDKSAKAGIILVIPLLLRLIV